MSTLSQHERQALNEIFGVIAQKETRISKIKNIFTEFFYFLKYFLKDKTSTKLFTR